MRYHEEDLIEGIPDKLSTAEKKRLKKLFAIVMEKAYRRAVQQTLHFVKCDNRILPSILNDCGCSYRYERPLDKSPGIDGFNRLSSEERLGAEHWWARQL